MRISQKKLNSIKTVTSILLSICIVLSLFGSFPRESYAQGNSDVNNGNWSASNVALKNTHEAQLMVRVGDIDNFGFGWESGFDPFSGKLTKVHSFPWTTSSNEPQGLDRIMVVSGYNLNNQATGTNRDGYTESSVTYNGDYRGIKEGNKVKPVVLEYEDEIQGINVENASLQMFVDDIQPGNANGVTRGNVHYNLTINGVHIAELDKVINNLDQSGPKGNMITFKIPDRFINLIQSGSLSIKIDDERQGITGDGYAIDFVKLLVNVKGFSNVGTVEGYVRHGNTEIPGATVSAGDVVSTVTDQNGYYRLEGIPAGQSIITASKPGYKSKTHHADIVEYDIKSRDFNLVQVEKIPTPQITHTPSKGQVERVMVNIEYPSSPEIKEYRIGDGQWKTYEDPFEVMENVAIEAKGKTVYEDYENISETAVHQITNIRQILEGGIIRSANMMTETESLLMEEHDIRFSFGGEPVNYGVQKKLDIVLVLNNSMTMKNNMDDLENAVKNFLNNFTGNEDVRIGVVCYNRVGFVPKELDWQEKKRRLYRADELIDISGNLKFNMSNHAGTNDGDGLRNAYDLLKRGRDDADKHIVFMTDGVPNQAVVRVSKNSNSYKYYNKNYNYDHNVSQSDIESYVRPYYLTDIDNIAHSKEVESDTGDNRLSRPIGQDYAVAIAIEINKKNLNIHSHILRFVRKSGAYTDTPEVIKNQLNEVANALGITDYIKDGEKYYRINEASELQKAFEDIGNKISESLSFKSFVYEQTIPAGVKLIEYPEGLVETKNDDGTTTLRGNIGNVSMIKNNEGMFEVKGNFKIRVKYERPGMFNIPAARISYTDPKGNKGSISTNTENVEVKKSSGSSIRLTQEIKDSRYKVGENFTVKYKIKPQPIPVENIVPEAYLKDKEIMLVMDTSGSMGEGIGLIAKEGESPKDNSGNEIYYDSENEMYYRIEEYYDYWGKREENVYYRYQRDDGDNILYWDDANNLVKMKKRMSVAKKSAKTFVDKFKGGNRVKIGLVDYDNRAEIEDINGNKLVVPDKFGQLKDKIDSNLEVEGGTNIGDGMRRAYWTLKNSSDDKARKIIVLMTDGEPTAFSFDSAERKRGNKWNAVGGIYYSDDTFDYVKYIGFPGYKDDSGIAEEIFTNYGSGDINGYSLEYAKEIGKMVAQDDLDISTFVIGFTNGINEDKLEQIKNASAGEYHRATSADALNEVYEKIANKIQSELTVSNLNFEGSFASGLEIVSVQDGLEINGDRISGRLQNISYKLNAEKTLYEAENPVEFEVVFKGTKAGEYENIGGSVNYTDINGEKAIASFEGVDVSIVDNEPPQIKAALENADGSNSKYTLTVVVNEKADIQILDSNGDVVAEIDKNNLSASEDEFIGRNIEISKSDVQIDGGMFITVKATDEEGNEASETVSLVELEPIELDDYENETGELSKTGTVKFNVEEKNVTIELLEINGEMVAEDELTDDGLFERPGVILNDGKNTFEIEVINQYGNTTTMEFTKDIDAKPPTVTIENVEEDKKFKVTFDEPVSEWWIEVDLDGDGNISPDEIFKSSDFTFRDLGGNSYEVTVNPKWYDKTVTVKGKDQSNNIGKNQIEIGHPVISGFLKHGKFTNAQVVESEDNKAFKETKGIKPEYGLDFSVFGRSDEQDVRLTLDDKITGLEFALYKVEETSGQRVLQSVEDSEFSIHLVETGFDGSDILSEALSQEQIKEELLKEGNIQFKIKLPESESFKSGKFDHYVLKYKVSHKADKDDLMTNIAKVNALSKECQIKVVVFSYT